METTSRRFDSIMRRFATGSPRSIAFASVTSSDAVSSLWRPTAARKSRRPAGGPGQASSAVCGAGHGFCCDLRLLGLGLLRLRRDGLRQLDLEPDRLELAREPLDLVLV